MMTVEELAALDARLSANADKLIAKREKSLFNFSPSKAGRKPASFCNLIQPEIQQIRYMDEESWPLWVDDVVAGVSRLDWYSNRENQRPLSTKNIMQCFACLEEINASTISHLLNIGERQAQVYMKACVILHDRLVDNYCDDNVRLMKYPAVFIYPREHVPQTDLKED
ncbi:hypothetical protein phiPsa267_019 [Pseudomonas phage phiPsa267]|uniref:Uncharacterized protein n=6 Tax=Otagovirus TaxID=2560197 RepID=A0A7G9V0V2_9CAUD|nr:hypothetical protein CF96_gp017 [Pseudomonas phage phiPsa374]YP_010767109.1 hypothetical protein QGX16_gp019 [Pseudomonas phage phiPsa397]YP_010767281.1 hypothetical protein QGX17_gp018 [Pseudomonas phage phiPsa381]YP_010767456.1 hypothetical protein QGX18_gp020 [Pseudomonas phage phiPsa347]YP_010767629.1 hypothetical protein QGX19_gp019 [Pseudomonas phage phiPsa267]YP_010767803.1 hypothetical protein QGX20_gp017 [Pseudomonas phage phiPsa300]AHJ87275.1 hypothetical protein phiPsa374_017 [P